ncbi:hypothetical protein ABZT04_08240, partial [Streptomyces sp. NPDC005492]|uniref:hypothetical protein n=1 Tax=Streptomyces sp. NPDC005492 TaxID=3156883 RepID=UPI0033AF418B
GGACRTGASAGSSRDLAASWSWAYANWRLAWRGRLGSDSALRSGRGVSYGCVGGEFPGPGGELVLGLRQLATGLEGPARL